MSTPDSPDPFKSDNQQPDPSIVAELWALLKHNKKWWLAPIIVCLLLVAGLIVLGGSAAAPFIYTLF